MTTWDELATAEAERRDRRDSDWYALHADELFRQGAAWQREQLLTDESVERAAMAILFRNYRGRTPDEARWVAGASGVDDARNKARTALTAAIGDQS